MKITDVRVRKLTDEGKMKCIVSFSFNNLFVVHDIKVIEGHNGLFIAMPSRKIGEGNFRDIAHPINAEMRQMLEDEVLKAYHEAVSQLEVATE
ncbi:septation regulator SpoVG [Paeniclostridium sordellii]|uniref:septation regulator SpoVG n=1 Tax=Paraclostridium sordellii TaxID=1505 RepID=UPI00210BB31E|nr:septation regulator SpoVG [Paeniclostridium sordellii]MCQ4699205.1 septation regulator SpoVG [Paeniclostridium sordellii]